MFPYDATTDPQVVLDYSAGLGAEALLITPKIAADFEHASMGQLIHAGDIYCDGTSGSEAKRLNLTMWRHGAQLRMPEPWVYTAYREFEDWLMQAPRKAGEAAQPDFALLDQLGEMLIAAGYDRAITANTVTLWYRVYSMPVPPNWRNVNGRFRAHELLMQAAELVSNVTAYRTLDLMEALYVGLTPAQVADYAGQQIPWDYVRQLHAPWA